MLYSCINLHFTDFCNYHCEHCFVKKENFELSMEKLKIIVDKIDNYFKRNNIDGRINLAGGEPLLSRNIDDLIEYIHSKGIRISIITNGYFLNEAFVKRYAGIIETIGISVDSINYETNVKIGRCCNEKVLDKRKLVYMCKVIKDNKMNLKINTCISKLNINEDFNSLINEIQPDRFKVFQIICSNNKESNLKNQVSSIEMDMFLAKIKYPFVYESECDMIDSYLIVDSVGNISTDNMHISNLSIFDYEIEEAISTLKINYHNYLKRYL